MVNCLKTKQSLSDLKKKAITSLGVKETEIREIGLEIHYLKAFEPLNIYRQRLEKENDYSQSKFETINIKMINDFWERCLQKVGELPEHQFILNKNDKLLEEAKDLRREIIARIKNTIKSEASSHLPR